MDQLAPSPAAAFCQVSMSDEWYARQAKMDIGEGFAAHGYDERFWPFVCDLCCLEGRMLTLSWLHNHKLVNHPLQYIGTLNYQRYVDAKIAQLMKKFGDNTNGCVTAGAHFNPDGKTDGGPKDTERHVGDLGNITAGADGIGNVDVTDAHIALLGARSVVSRSMVVHELQDDLGRGTGEKAAESKKTAMRVRSSAAASSAGPRPND